MTTISQAAVTKAINLLNAVQAKFYIIGPDGTHHKQGVDLAPHPPQGDKKHKPRSRRMTKLANEGRSIGDLAGHIKPYLMQMQAGDVKKVPFGRFVHNVVASSVSANAIHMWGKGNAVIATQKDGVEILRVA